MACKYSHFHLHMETRNSQTTTKHKTKYKEHIVIQLILTTSYNVILCYFDVLQIQYIHTLTMFF